MPRVTPCWSQFGGGSAQGEPLLVPVWWPREGRSCKIRVLIHIMPATNPKSCVETRCKRAWKRWETRGKLWKPAWNFGNLQETHGNLQEPRRKFAGTHRKPAGNLQETRKKPAGDPWKTWKTCSVETCAETQTKPAKHLGKETREGNLYEAQSNLQQSCGNSQETCLWETWKPGKPRTTWILAL